jgi:UDP-glucuronate 4-epimerase
LRVEKLGDSLGDVTETGADIDKAKRLLNWKPNVGLREGLFQQVEWQKRQIK